MINTFGGLFDRWWDHSALNFSLHLFTFIEKLYLKLHFKDTLKALGNFKNKQQKCMEWCFLLRKSIYITKVYKVYIFLKFIQYTIDWDKIQM